MKVIEPIAVDEAVLTDSNITEDDHGEWNAGTTYSAQQRVILAVEHKVYESIQDGNVGKDPTLEPDWWLEISATNKWRAFDLVLGDKASQAGSITYELVPPSFCTGLAFFGLQAGSVRVKVFNDADPAEKIYDETVNLVDTTNVVDWQAFFFGSVEYDSEALLVGIPGFTGFRIEISIEVDAGNAEVGQIVLGQVHTLGETTGGTSIGIEDFSGKERDQFGNARIVERAFIDETEFHFAMATDDARRVK
ncbi:MAG: hypothetical protein AB3N24_23180, partial [Leisingera sp.]